MDNRSACREDDDVGGAHGLVRPGLADLLRDVDAALGYGSDGGGVDGVSGLAGDDPVAGGGGP
jgi:hypothetical protein